MALAFNLFWLWFWSLAYFVQPCFTREQLPFPRFCCRHFQLHGRHLEMTLRKQFTVSQLATFYLKRSKTSTMPSPCRFVWTINRPPIAQGINKTTTTKYLHTWRDNYAPIFLYINNGGYTAHKFSRTNYCLCPLYCKSKTDAFHNNRKIRT